MVGCLFAVPAQALTITLDFEWIGNLDPVCDFYNGGGGTGFGVEFSGGALGLIDQDVSGTGNFGNEPTPDTVLFFLTGAAAKLNLPITPRGSGDPTGRFNVFVPIGVEFAGTARSIDLGGTENRIAFDNITFGSSAPGETGGTGGPVIPLPAGAWLLIGGLGGLAALRRRKSA